jgi:hypothetical protein
VPSFYFFFIFTYISLFTFALLLNFKMVRNPAIRRSTTASASPPPVSTATRSGRQPTLSAKQKTLSMWLINFRSLLLSQLFIANQKVAKEKATKEKAYNEALRSQQRQEEIIGFRKGIFPYLVTMLILLIASNSYR